MTQSASAMAEALRASERALQVAQEDLRLQRDEAASLRVDLGRIEERLRHGEARMRLAVESTRDFAILTLDPQGIVTSWNLGAERLFGWTAQEIVGQPGALLFTPEDRARGVPDDEMRRSQAHGRAEDERWHVRKDGRSFYCSGVMTPLRGEGLAGHAKIARDLTLSKLNERRREAVLSAEQHRRAELQAANALKDQFLAVLSHELKNPLNLIQLHAELLARLPEVQGQPAVARATEVIRQTVRSQARLIDDLLDLSRVTAGKLTLDRAPVSVMGVIDRVVDTVRDDAVRRQLRLTTEARDPDLQALADAGRLEQIVVNLLSNALKFTPAGGAVHVSVAREDDRVRIDVADTGRGFDPRLAAPLFHPFRQGEAPTTREHGGLGVGLALVKHLAELHEGRAEASSEGRDRGARFSVWLPLSEAHSPARSDRLGPLSGLRVLAVDDAADALDAFAMLLALHGAAVTKACSGPQALDAAQHASFDLILSDIAMPGMDGHALLRRLRQDSRFADVPAVAITGFGREQDVQRALDAGFDAHMGKPVEMPRLIELLQTLDAGRRRT